MSIVLFVLSAVVAGVAVSSLLGCLPRNRFAGVRTAESMRDDETFVMANRVAGPATAAAAVILLVGGVAGLIFSGLLALAAAVVSVIAALVVAAAGGSIGARAAAATATAPAEATGGCGHACTSCSLKDACQPSSGTSSSGTSPIGSDAP